MLVNFEFNNFLSYNVNTKFMMRATKATRLSSHLLNPSRLLSLTAIFGGNGSGKSNLIKAVKFSKSIILDEEYDYNNFYNLRFRGCESENNIGKFKYSFYVDEILYDYLIEYDYLQKRIFKEELRETIKNKVLFSYHANKISLNYKELDKKEKQRLDIYVDDFINEKTNRTFLNYLYFKNSENSKFLKKIENVYLFFYKIIIIEPSSQYIAIDELFSNKEVNINEILNNYGFNIVNYKETEESISGLFNSEYEELKNKIISKIKENNDREYRILKDNIPYKYKLDENGNLRVYRIAFMHDNNEIFEYEDESDGTKRIFDLLPVIYLLNNEKYIFFIDEIDRSLSAHLCYELLNSYIKEVEKGVKRQLIFTTHNQQLLDFDLLRKDEIWFVENDDELCGSQIKRFSDIDFRTDMDLKNAFWKGSIGGVSKKLIKTMERKKN